MIGFAGIAPNPVSTTASTPRGTAIGSAIFQ